MTNIVDVALAVIVGLSANFHDGLKNLENKAYAQAVTNFTAVITAEPTVAEMKALSLLYRAEAYGRAGSKAEALQDAATLLKTTEDAAQRKKALALYAAHGGELKDLRPKVGPKARMDAFFAALQKADVTAAKQSLSGPLLHLVQIADKVYAAESRRDREGVSFLSEFARESGMFVFAGESFNDTNQTATLSISIQNHMVFTLGLVQQEGAWTAATVQDIRKIERPRPVDRANPPDAREPPQTVIRKEDVPEAVAAEVLALIVKLGDADARLRADARRRLKEIGTPATPFLRDQVNHADPEIQSAVRELLK
ncbi:MAG: hypothetical protein FJ222_11910 [Lentisphaerae bacterium]|nr:hypothetical protein [Lentisphaerota bacterium]